MKRRVILSPAAQADRRQTRAWYLRPGSGEYVRSRLIALETAIANLADRALMHRLGPVAGSRLLISQGHRLLHEIRRNGRSLGNEDVVALRIYGPGQSDD